MGLGTNEFLIAVLVRVSGLLKHMFLSLSGCTDSAIFKFTAGPHPIRLDEGYFSLNKSSTTLPTGSTYMQAKN